MDVTIRKHKIQVRQLYIVGRIVAGEQRKINRVEFYPSAKMHRKKKTHTHKVEKKIIASKENHHHHHHRTGTSGWTARKPKKGVFVVYLTLMAYFAMLPLVS